MTKTGPIGLVVIAASAGGVRALQIVLSSLPGDFPVPICIVQHRTARPPRPAAGRKIRFVLSSANPLFASAAKATGKRTIGIVLAGGDADATDGIQAIKQEGGIVIAQDRGTAKAV